ncbi:glycosyl hydrolase 53 family protein [Mitsuokella multacida]|uniref:glycosyl hydrolase 53 family protein n=1 Tax=Mitsuokella multacida TaxID=52226 RepID=UPI003F6325F8
MANEKMEKPDFSKIWGENGNVTYQFSDDNYLKGWGFVGNIPPARGMFDAYFQGTDKKLKWLDGALGDYVNRDYTIDDTKNPTDNKDTLPNLLSGMANMIKTTNGTDDWKKPSATSLKDLSDQIASNNLYHAEATGYGIVSGCEPSINGLTVTVSAGVIHTANGRRIEVPEQSITLDAADVSRNDIVYFDKNCTVQVKKGTDAEVASTPTIDAETIEVCIVYINGSTTNIADARKFISTSALFKRALPKYKSLSDTMGILLHTEYWGDTYLEVLYKSPYRIIRTTPMWSSCETEKGVYNFDKPLALAKKLAAHGKIGSWIMSFSNELYTSAGRSGINTDDARSAFANYCSAWVTALANAGIKGQIIEIYNEPNNSNFWSENNVISAEEYTKLVKCVYPKIKAADTTATVVTHNIMNGIYLSGMKWIKRTIDAGVLDYTDGISIHPYVNAKPETMSNAYDMVRSLIAGATTKDIPIYVCEVGYSACQNYDGTTGLNAIAIESMRKNISHGYS